MKRRLYFLVVSLVVAVFIVSCGSESKCPMTTSSTKQGKMAILGEIKDLNVDLWRTYQADYCDFDPKQGFVNRGVEGIWYEVRENHDGDLMILVEINKDGGDQAWPGWIDCRYVEITTTENGRDLTEMEQACSDAIPE